MNLRKDHYWRETICPKRTYCDCGVPGLFGMSGCLSCTRAGWRAVGRFGRGSREEMMAPPLFREALVSWGWRPRRRFKESRRPRGRVPPPGYFFFFFYHSHMLKKPTCRKLPRPQCLCVLAKLFVDDDCWKSKEKENNFRRWITRLVRR